MKLFLQQNGNTVAGRQVQIILKDDGGVSPDVTKRLAQELVARDNLHAVPVGVRLDGQQQPGAAALRDYVRWTLPAYELLVEIPLGQLLDCAGQQLARLAVLGHGLRVQR